MAKNSPARKPSRPSAPQGRGTRGPNKPTYKGRRLARPASRGRHGGK